MSVRMYECKSVVTIGPQRVHNSGTQTGVMKACLSFDKMSSKIGKNL